MLRVYKVCSLSFGRCIFGYLLYFAHLCVFYPVPSFRLSCFLRGSANIFCSPSPFVVRSFVLFLTIPSLLPSTPERVCNHSRATSCVNPNTSEDKSSRRTGYRSRRPFSGCVLMAIRQHILCQTPLHVRHADYLFTTHLRPNIHTIQPSAYTHTYLFIVYLPRHSRFILSCPLIAYSYSIGLYTWLASK